MDAPNDAQWVTPSADEVDGVARVALGAAWGELAPFRDADLDIEPRAGIRAIIAAFTAVRTTVASADERLAAHHPGLKCHGHYLDEHHIVASALETVNYLDPGCSHYSRAGFMTILFASACRAMEHLAEAEGALLDSEYLHGGAMAVTALTLLDTSPEP